MTKRVSTCILLAALSVAGGGCVGEELATQTQDLVPVGDFLTLLSPTNTLGFVAQNIGTSSAGQQLTLANSGTVNLTFTSFTFTGLNPGDFAFGPLATCATGTVLAPAQTCVVDVVFTPTAAGPRSTRITVVDSANGTPHIIPIAGLGRTPGAAVPTVGPIDLRVGYPAYYQDVNGIKLQLCYDNATQCLTTIPNTAVPPKVDDTGSNFIDESFYWSAQVQNARVGTGLNGRATLTLALEATFLNAAGAIIPADQLVFGRVRFRLQKMPANTTYTVTHPYGSLTVTTDSGGSVTETVDIGCASTPCDFRGALDSPILASPFLKWDPAVLPLAPAGFLGNPTVAHAIVGSPTGNNFLRIVGTNAGGTGVNTVTFTQFTLSGELL